MEQVSDCNEFAYQLLSRLKQDCEYYLGFGQRNKNISGRWMKRNKSRR